jgi:type I restriction enzyme, S subunit
MKSYPSYKGSGVEWIGEIPSKWSKSKLKFSLESIVTGGTPDTSNDSYWSDVQNGINWISISDITSNGREIVNTKKHISEKGLESKRLEILPIGSLIYSIYGSIGKVSRLGIPSTIHQGILGLKTNLKYNSVFLEYYLIYFKEYVSLFSSSNTQENLNQEKVSNFEIPFPPITEQIQIVSFLDTKTQKIDELIEKTEKKIELLKEKRLKLVEGILLNPNTKRIRLEYVVDLVKRPIERKENNTYTKVGMYNWGRGIFQYNSELGLELGDSSFFYLKEGDLLISGQFAWEGSVSLVEKDENNCISSHRFHILNGKEDKVLNEYLWSYFTSQEGHFILSENSSGSAGRNRPLNIGKLLKEKILIPDMDIQMEIKSLVIETKNYEKYSKQRIELLKEYRQSLISEVVTGKVDVRD